MAWSWGRGSRSGLGMVQVKVTGTVMVADSGQAKASPGEAFTGKSRWDLALDTLMRVWITTIICKCVRDNFHHLFDSLHHKKFYNM